MAPEILRFTNKLKFSEASDIWAYGITLWEIYTLGEQPYSEFIINDVPIQILHGVTPEIPDGCPPVINEIMSKCLKFNPRDRWTFDEINSKFEIGNENVNQCFSVPIESNEHDTTENAHYFLVHILFLFTHQYVSIQS